MLVQSYYKPSSEWLLCFHLCVHVCCVWTRLEVEQAFSTILDNSGETLSGRADFDEILV